MTLAEPEVGGCVPWSVSSWHPPPAQMCLLGMEKCHFACLPQSQENGADADAAFPSPPPPPLLPPPHRQGANPSRTGEAAIPNTQMKHTRLKTQFLAPSPSLCSVSQLQTARGRGCLCPLSPWVCLAGMVNPMPVPSQSRATQGHEQGNPATLCYQKELAQRAGNLSCSDMTSNI